MSLIKIIEGLDNIRSRMPRLEALGIAITDKFIVLRFSWNHPDRPQAELVIERVEIEDLLADNTQLDQSIIDKMNTHYRIFEVGEE